MVQLIDDQLTGLTPPERLALISRLWESLEGEQFLLTATQRMELDHRFVSLEQDRRERISWEALKNELEQRCP
jgi:putative addiction module component (TIGR02574 family)